MWMEGLMGPQLFLIPISRLIFGRMALFAELTPSAQKCWPQRKLKPSQEAKYNTEFPAGHEGRGQGAWLVAVWSGGSLILSDERELWS